MSRLLGERKPTLPAGQPSGPDPETVSPWPGCQLACLRAHADTDTNEEPTMAQLSSKIERPLPGPPEGSRGCSHHIARPNPTRSPRRLIPGSRSASGPNGMKPGFSTPGRHERGVHAAARGPCLRTTGEQSDGRCPLRPGPETRRRPDFSLLSHGRGGAGLRGEEGQERRPVRYP